MAEPTFDIFRGTNDKDAIWVDAVEGFSSARDRMDQIAAERPGQYFVFAPRTRAILLRTDTTKTFEGPAEKRMKGAA